MVEAVLREEYLIAGYASRVALPIRPDLEPEPPY